MLISKALYTRHPALTASQILTVRGVLSTIVAAGLTNKELKSALWTGIPDGCGVKVAKRSLQASFNVWLQFSLTRCMSLVYVSLSQNMTPWVTAIWAYFWIGERLKMKDILMICTTFIGVTLITLGFAEDKHKSQSPSIWAAVACFMVPILLAYAAILMSTMKGLHQYTVALYLNPTLTFFMILDQVVQGDSPYIFTQLDGIDWLLLLVFGVNAFAVQTLKYLALQYQDPAKLSHYQYMNSVYQLMYDLFLFNAVFSDLQWWGLIVMIMSYVTVGGTGIYLQYKDDKI
jgi:drug/metabolite transporter (DMT)-like permease